jgi:glycosyltransferase involved in cell wall biosynthesis
MTVRILHVVRQMNAGGIAVWLMNVLRRADRERCRMDFLVTTDAPCAYADEIQGLGGRVIPCLGQRKPWQFARSFGEVLRDCGPYDVVHSHIFNFSGFVLRLAARHGVPVRIAHSHTDTRLKEASLGWHQRLWRAGYLSLTKRWIGRYGTLRVGVSALAAEALFGRNWATDRRSRVLPLGLDFSAFRVRHDAAEVRRSLGLPTDALVIGHVGNYVWHKNHDFLIEIAAEALRQEPRAWLLLIGHHLLGSPIGARVHALGLADRVVIAGPRDDVPRLMTAALDVFLFPSHYEGFGLVLLEAQAAGVPCVFTDSLPTEVDVLPALVQREPLAAPAADWARTTLAAADHRPLSREDALAGLLQSEFNIERSVQTLMQIYERGP